MSSLTQEIIKRFSSDGTSNDEVAQVEPEGEHLLTDEELVIQFVSESGGRTLQSKIATGLEWSKPKTSIVLSAMEDAGIITRYRVGRQKAVALPDHTPQHIK